MSAYPVNPIAPRAARVWRIPKDDIDLWNPVLYQRLIPLNGTDTLSSAGSVSFKYLQKTRQEPGDDGYILQKEGELESDDLIFITLEEEDPNVKEINWDLVDWFGYVKSINYAKTVSINGRIEKSGSVVCMGMGAQLDQSQVTGWRAKVGASTMALSDAPSANVSIAYGKILGNAVAITDGPDTFTVFESDPAACGFLAANYWSTWELLRHFLKYVVPATLTAFPPIILSSTEFPGLDTYLQDVTAPRVYENVGLTARGVLDILLPAAQGLGWRLVPTSVGMTLKAVAIAELPGVTLTDPDIQWSAVNLKDGPQFVDGGDIPDSVTVSGAPVLFGTSICYADGNFDKAWSATGQAAYIAASITDRQLPQYGDIYTRYRLLPDSSSRLTRGATPASGSGSLTLAMCPEITVGSTGTVTVADNVDVAVNHKTPYIPTASLASIFPWEEGRPASTGGTDYRTASQLNQPVYRKPWIALADSTKSNAFKWIDLCGESPEVRVSLGINGPNVDADDRALGLRMRCSPQHNLGRADVPSAQIDWQKIVLTVGVHSAQRLSYTIINTESSSSAVGRTLNVSDDRLQYWAILPNTVLGIYLDSGVATPRRSGSTTEAVRNDAPALVRYCTQLAAWAFRRRVSVNASIAGLIKPTWLHPGQRIFNMNVDGATTACNTSITLVSRDYTNQTSGFVTDAPPRPALAISGSANGSPSPSAGGSVSPVLGGTVAQAVQVTQTNAGISRAQGQRAALIIPPPINTPVYSLTGCAGNTIATVYGSTLSGIKSASPAAIPTSTPVVGIYTDGLGYGTLDGVLVWVVNNNFGYPVPSTVTVFSLTTVTLPCTAGGTATAYVITGI